MGRLNKPWFRQDVGWGVTNVRGKQIRLAKGKSEDDKRSKAEAERVFHGVMALVVSVFGRIRATPDAPICAAPSDVENIIADRRPASELPPTTAPSKGGRKKEVQNARRKKEAARRQGQSCTPVANEPTESRPPDSYRPRQTPQVTPAEVPTDM